MDRVPSFPDSRPPQPDKKLQAYHWYLWIWQLVWLICRIRSVDPYSRNHNSRPTVRRVLGACTNIFCRSWKKWKLCHKDTKASPLSCALALCLWVSLSSNHVYHPGPAHASLNKVDYIAIAPLLLLSAQYSSFGKGLNQSMFCPRIEAEPQVWPVLFSPLVNESSALHTWNLTKWPKSSLIQWVTDTRWERQYVYCVFARPLSGRGKRQASTIHSHSSSQINTHSEGSTNSEGYINASSSPRTASATDHCTALCPWQSLSSEATIVTDFQQNSFWNTSDGPQWIWQQGLLRSPKGPRKRVRHQKVCIEEKRRVNMGDTKLPPNSKDMPCPRNTAFLRSYLEWAWPELPFPIEQVAV